MHKNERKTNLPSQFDSEIHGDLHSILVTLLVIFRIIPNNSTEVLDIIFGNLDFLSSELVINLEGFDSFLGCCRRRRS